MSEGSEGTSEATLCEVLCLLCRKRWTAFLPDGISNPQTLECPACHAASGLICDDQGNPL